MDMESTHGYSEHGKLNNTNSVFQAETIAKNQAAHNNTRNINTYSAQ